MSKRRQRILSFINTEGQGLEIGPSFNPMAPKKEGFNVEVIDYASQEDLRENYRGDNYSVDIEAIEEVDYVWQGQSYRELVGEGKQYDWIIASHVIEHVPDLVAFINGCSEVLKDDGVLALVVPDARYCFDQFRPISSLSAVLDAHNAGLTRHTPGSVIEFFMNYSERSGNHFWRKNVQGENTLFNANQDAARYYQELLADRETYVDIHKWCFTPSSFRLMISDLNELGVIEMKESSFSNESKQAEFCFALSRQPGDHVVPDRLALLERVQEELAAPSLTQKGLWWRLFARPW